MGNAMSLTLLRHHFPLTAFDIAHQATSKFQSAASEIPDIEQDAAGVAPSPAAACKTVNLVLFMVANQAHVESALLAPESGAIHTMAKGAVILICSTVSPTYIIELRQRLDSELQRPDLLLIDAPVSGGVARSATGTLTIMASSHQPSDLDRADILSVLKALSDGGKNLYVVPGGLGSGQKLKALNQVNCGINIAGASEVMGCAAALGLDTKKFYEHIIADVNGKKRDGWTWMLENRGPRMLNPSLAMASATAIIVKDVGIILDEAKQRKCSLPLESKAKAVLDRAMDRGLASVDDSRVVEAYLGTGRDDLVIKQSGNSLLSEKDQDTLTAMLGTAHSCVHLQGAYETGIFADALGLVKPEQVDQWIRILGGAAGGSPVFSAAVESVYGPDRAGASSKSQFEGNFKQFATEIFEIGKKATVLQGLVNFAKAKEYEVPEMQETLAWISRDLLS